MSEATLAQTLAMTGTVVLTLLLATIGVLALVIQLKARDGRTAAGRDRANLQRRRAEALDRFLFREGMTLQVTGMGRQTHVEISGEDLRPVALRQDPRDPWQRRPEGQGNSLQNAKARLARQISGRVLLAGPAADGRRQVRVPDLRNPPESPLLDYRASPKPAPREKRHDQR